MNRTEAFVLCTEVTVPSHGGSKEEQTKQNRIVSITSNDIQFTHKYILYIYIFTQNINCTFTYINLIVYKKISVHLFSLRSFGT